MSQEYITEVKKWMTKKELVEEIKNKQIEARVLERLYFIKYLYEGDDVPKASDKVEISDNTGYDWRKRWNENGLEGLYPNFDGGPNPKLDSKEKEKLKEVLEKRSDWTTKEVKNLIEDEFEVSYTERHVSRILENFGMNHGKPYQQDYRRPDDAEEKLKKKLTEKLEEKNKEEIIIGFSTKHRLKIRLTRNDCGSLENQRKKKTRQN